MGIAACHFIVWLLGQQAEKPETDEGKHLVS